MLFPRWANGRPGDGKARNSFPLGHGRQGGGVGSPELSGFGGSSSTVNVAPRAEPTSSRTRARRLRRAQLDEAKGTLPEQLSHREPISFGVMSWMKSSTGALSC